MANKLLRQIPQVNKLAAKPAIAGLEGAWSRPEIISALRVVLQGVRGDVRSGGTLPDFDNEDFAGVVEKALVASLQLSLRGIINGTGIIIHTNLGRAPLAPRALQAIEDAARGYANIEFDLVSGKRGSRYDHVRDLICELTGAEDAVVVNNCAAAVTLAMATFAKDSEVIVSRGELVEIGGSFRVPDVIAQNGSRMVEVGTTNKTHMADYEQALSEDSAVILRTHTSNYRVVGFTAKPSMQELATFAAEHDLFLIEDLGSGSLVDLASLGVGDEPTVRQSVEAGAHLVMFSGDKLLGGPQAGIIVGKADMIATIRKNPLLRAMRIDKLSLAALEATLRLYQPPYEPADEVPVLQMLTARHADLKLRAEALAADLGAIAGVSAATAPTNSEAGGGSLPTVKMESECVTLEISGLSAAGALTALRGSAPPIIGRVAGGKAQLDMRTLMPGDSAAVVGAVMAIADAAPAK